MLIGKNMISTRTYDLDDYFCKSIKISFIQNTNQFSSFTVQTSNGMNWNSVAVLGEPHVSSKCIEICLTSSRFEAIRLSIDENETSYVKIRGKWSSLKKPQINFAKSKTEITPSRPEQKSIPLSEKVKPSGILFRNKLLTKDSPFHEVAQYLAENYYLKAYLDEKSEGKINRFHHGVTHAVTATYTADNVLGHSYVDAKKKSYQGGLFIELLKKYCPTQYWDILRELNGGADLTEEDFLLIKYAIFCHDIANTQEHFKDEKAHATIFINVMTRLGFSAAKIQRYADAIINKDAKIPKNLLQMLVHDADCWEFNRILFHSDEFDIEELDIVKLLRKKLEKQPKILQKALEEIKQIAHFYFYIMNYIYNSDPKDVAHEYCEFSDNCYLQIVKLLQALRMGYHLSFDYSLNTLVENINHDDYVGPLEFYNPNLLDKSSFVLRKVFKGAPFDEKRDTTLECYRTDGVYIRMLSNIKEEIHTVKNNNQILAAKNIKKSEELKQYFTNTGPLGQAKLLAGFKYRPSTLIREGLAIESAGYGGVGLIFNPKAPSVHATHFYKDNVGSNSIAFQYLFQRPERIKNVETHSSLLKKLIERECRRCGLIWDNYNRHYGSHSMSHNEILLHYDLDAIIGIVVSERPSAAQEALNLRKLLNKDIKFYFYNSKYGLKLVPDEEIFKLAGITDLYSSYQFNCHKTAKERFLHDVTVPDYDSIYRSIDISRLTEVHCSLEQHNPSIEHPITYSFSHVDSKIPGKAYFKNGMPIVEINGQQFNDTDNLLPAMATEYQRRKIEECNILLKKLSTEMVYKFKIKNINLAAHDDRGKPFLKLSFENSSLSQSTPDVASILDYIGYDHKQWKTELIKSPTSSSVEIRLSVLQSISAISKQLKLHQPMLSQQAMTTKFSGVKHAPYTKPSKHVAASRFPF